MYIGWSSATQRGGLGKSTKVDTNLIYSVSILDGVLFMDAYFIAVLHKLY